MVLLIQTPAILTALESYASQNPHSSLQANDTEPSLTSPTLGAPISHSQILQLFHTLKTQSPANHSHLPDLLLGSKVYTPPPAPKPQPSSEYLALMARLRAEQESRDYQKMLTPATAPSGGKNPYTRFAAPKTAAAWDLGIDIKPGDEDTGAMQDIDAQISLIVNVVVSIVACGGAFFLLLRYTGWSDGIRVLASMFGALVVGLAEVVLYASFVRKVGEGKMIERGIKEERSIENTWVIEGSGKEVLEKIGREKVKVERADALRRRKGKMKDDVG